MSEEDRKKIAWAIVYAMTLTYRRPAVTVGEALAEIEKALIEGKPNL